MSGGSWDVDRLRFATEAAGVALWSWNVDTDRMTMDELAFRLWGLTPKPNVTFEELSACIHPADLDKVRASFAATRERFGPYETDFRILIGDEVRWISARGRGDDQGIVGRIMYGIFIDVSVRKRAEEARELISGEMHHRIKNLFSLAAALAGIASRTTTTKEAMTRDLTDRLIALSAAHELIRPDIDTRSRAGDIGAILGVLLKPYMDSDLDDSRLMISVPKIRVGEHSATAIAMIVHELATNSMKYGALSTASGRLAISGRLQADDVEMTWNETGGPPVAASPRSPGFGTKLVMRCVKEQLNGTMNVEWQRAGVVISFTLALAQLGA
jgi:two-component sensor histidine kinase